MYFSKNICKEGLALPTSTASIPPPVLAFQFTYSSMDLTYSRAGGMTVKWDKIFLHLI